MNWVEINYFLVKEGRSKLGSLFDIEKCLLMMYNFSKTITTYPTKRVRGDPQLLEEYNQEQSDSG